MRMIMYLLLVCTSISTSWSQVTNRPEGKLYTDADIHTIYLTMPADSAEWLFEPGNEWNNKHIQATFVHEYGNNTDTVPNVGVRLRGNTSRTAGKKSIKISFNTFQKGRKYDGVEKLNLNGQHNDPSVTRAHLCQRLLYAGEVTTLMSSHTLLYINDEYMGVYLNTEHVDEEYVNVRYGNKDGNLYKCTYPADLLYRGPDPNLYKNDNLERPPYELITNKEENDYGDLALFIDVLNNTPLDDLPCALETIFNVSEYLRYAAFDVLVANWDGPIVNKNNFYLYHNTATGKFEYIPFDLDNTFGIDWFGENWAIRNVYEWSEPNRPIYQRLMAVPEYRDLYSYYMNEMLKGVFTNEWIGSFLDSKQLQLAPHIETDEYYARSYGYDIDDFNQSFTEGVGSNHARVGLKEYVSVRTIKAKNQLTVNSIAPVVRSARSSTNAAAQTMTITAGIWDDQDLDAVILYYKEAGGTDYNAVQMVKTASTYTATVDITPDIELQYYIAATDIEANTTLNPRCGSYSSLLLLSDLKLAINEIQASNSNTIADEAGEYDDWIELYNYDTETIDLEGLLLTDNAQNIAKWTLPSVAIAPSEYLLVWLDNDAEQGDLHASFRLSAAGEYVGLYDRNADLIDGIGFGPQEEDTAYGRLPDGNGPWQSLQPTPGASNMPLSSPIVQKTSISIYPNPTAETLSVQHEGNEAIIELTNTHGQVLIRQKSNEVSVIDVSEIPDGYYLIRLYRNNEVIHQQKLVKL